MAEVLDTFDELRTAGKIRLIGASVKGPRVTEETAELCRRYFRTGRVHALQVIYSLLRPGTAVIFAKQRGRCGHCRPTVLESGFRPDAMRRVICSRRVSTGSVEPEAVDRILGAVRDVTAAASRGRTVPELQYGACAAEVP
jgi:aryl-alcohol dehydrogenase-like predicted oxidoreductase